MADRTSILNHVLKLAPFEGWSEHTLELAAKQAGVSASAAFPQGITNCIDYFFQTSDEALEQTFPADTLSALRVPQRITTLVMGRLAYWASHREAVRRLVSTNALPWNMPRGLAALYRSVDLMWKLAGDSSTDFNFYTKRMTLAGVYSSTLLFWLNDTSEDQIDTKTFLERRLQNVADFGRWKKEHLG